MSDEELIGDPRLPDGVIGNPWLTPPAHTLARSDRDALWEAVERVRALVERMAQRQVDHWHEGIDGQPDRAYFYAGDVIDDIYALRTALSVPTPVRPVRDAGDLSLVQPPQTQGRRWWSVRSGGSRSATGSRSTRTACTSGSRR